jgi:hypothetical protein
MLRESLVLAASLVLLAVASAAEDAAPGKNSAGGPKLTAVALLIDVTGSLDVPTPRGGTRRTLYMDAGRVLIRETQRAGVPLAIGRLCGVSETLWGPAPVQRKDFAALTTVLQSGLASCAPPSTAVQSEKRRGGTDLVAGLRWLSRQPDGAILVNITDGLHEPPGSNGLAQWKLYAALDALNPKTRDRLWLIGVDEAVRDEIRARVTKTWGVFDVNAAIQALTREMGTQR